MADRLERRFAETFGASYAVSFVNGTATMHAALSAAGVGPGDEVIVPPLTMASTAFSVLHAHALPIFADVDPQTWTLDPEAVRRAITPRTKAIIPVALYGLSPDMDPIMDIARQSNITVIEDSAECVLGSYKGRTVGTIGHAGSFSFQSSKHMTSGEGGMVVTNSNDYATAIRRFSSLGYSAVGSSAGKITREIIQDPDYERHASIGWNYRMGDLNAAVALAQTERLHELVELRCRVAALFESARDNCPWLVPQKVPSDYRHVYWSWVVKLNNEGGFGWHEFRRRYVEFGGDSIYAAWQLTYREPAFMGREFERYVNPLEGEWPQSYEVGLCPVAESLQSNLFQFKTNYYDFNIAERKAEALAKTIAYFGS